MAKLKDGFYKQTAEDIGSDLYVLLAGGGSKPLSDFAYKSDLTGSVIGGPYIPLSGTANLSGPIVMSGISNSAPFIRNFTHEGDSGWAREIMDIQVDGSSKFKIGAYGSYINGESNGIIYAYLGCNSYDGLNLRITASSLNWGDNIVLHSDNYNSYSPTLTGTGASGTWGINISGTAANADTVDGYHAGLANGNVALYVPFPNSTTLKDKGYISASYGTDGYGYPDDEFLKGICKWAIDTYTNQGDITLMGVIAPNSSGTCIFHLYSSSGKDSTTGLPRWCRGQYLNLSGSSFHFGTTDYVWAYNRFAFAYELKNPTDYYWANVPISATSNAATNPTFGNTTINGTLGIGTSIPRSTLDVYGNDAAVIIGKTDNNYGVPTARKLRLGLGTAGHSGSEYWAFCIDDTTDSSYLQIGYTEDIVGISIRHDGFLGVGTNYPYQRLTVNGNIAFTSTGIIGASYDNSNTNMYNNITISSNVDGIRYSSGGWTGGNHIAHNFLTGNSDSSRLIIMNDGSIGIGTTSPAYKLDVVDNARLASICFEVNDEINRYDGNLFLQHRGTIAGSQGSARTGNIFMCANGGNVGIGTTSPIYKLSVDGAIWRHNTDYGIASDGRFYALSVYANRSGSATEGGVSLYAISDPMTYGIAFRGTGTYGIHGKVTSDWATYFTMNDQTDRGWIFRKGTTNVASVSSGGAASFAAVGTDKYIAYPQGGQYTYSQGSITGAIRITLPVRNVSTMLHFTVTIYNYVSGTSSTYYIAGYNFSGDGWHNCSAYSIRQGHDSKGNLTVRFADDGTKEYIYIGETDTIWSYPNIVVSNVLLGYNSQSFATWATGWSVDIVTSFASVETIINNPATNHSSDTVDGYHASDLVKFYLSPMTANAPADSAKSWFTDTMPSASGAIVYNVSGLEKTIIAGKSSEACGHMLQLNYDDTYLRILRYFNGSWKSTDWEKISAGYADFAGNADTLDGIDSTGFLRQVLVPHNTENDFNTFSNMTLTGRGDPSTGASLKNAPWTGSGPAGGYGVLTYLWSVYGIQMAWGYNSSRIYIRPRYYSSGTHVWSSTWDSIALLSDINTTNFPGLNKTGTVTSVATGTGLTGGTITTSGTISINSTYQTYISNGNTAYGWGNHADAGYIKSRGYIGTTTVSSSSNAGQNITGIGDITPNTTKVSYLGNSSLYWKEVTANIFRSYGGSSTWAAFYQNSSGNTVFENSSGAFYINSKSLASLKAASNQVILGSGTAAFYPNTTLTLGTSSQRWSYVYATHLNAEGGSFYTDANGAYWTSDARLKTNIVKARNLDIADLLVEFDWKESNEHSWGYIAQELLEVLPEAVSYNSDTDRYAVNYNVAHSAAIASLTARIKELEEKLKKYGIR